MSDLKDMIDALIAFCDDHDWAQFHNSKNLATAIGIEAAELNELFLWKTIKESGRQQFPIDLARPIKLCLTASMVVYVE